MWALVIFLFVQQGLDVILVNTRTDKEYQVESQCWARATVETKVLPLQTGNDARWQYATCVKVRP